MLSVAEILINANLNHKNNTGNLLTKILPVVDDSTTGFNFVK